MRANESKDELIQNPIVKADSSKVESENVPRIFGISTILMIGLKATLEILDCVRKIDIIFGQGIGIILKSLASCTYCIFIVIFYIQRLALC